MSAGRGVPCRGTELVMAKEGQWLVVVEACRASSSPGPGVEGVGWDWAPCGVMAGAVTSGNTGLTAAGLGIGNVTLSTRVRNLIVSVPQPTQAAPRPSGEAPPSLSSLLSYSPSSSTFFFYYIFLSLTLF